MQKPQSNNEQLQTADNEGVRRDGKDEIYIRSASQSNNEIRTRSASQPDSSPLEAVGIFTTVNIPRNEVVLASAPSLRSGLANTKTGGVLSETVQKFQMCPVEKSCDVCMQNGSGPQNNNGLHINNGITLSFPNSSICYEKIFAPARRVYQSAPPNACLSWSGTLKQLAFEALRDIEAGEELILGEDYYEAEKKWRALNSTCQCHVCCQATIQVHVHEDVGLAEEIAGSGEYICNDCKPEKDDTEEDMTGNMMSLRLSGIDAAGTKMGRSSTITSTSEDPDAMDAVWFSQQCL